VTVEGLLVLNWRCYARPINCRAHP